MSSSTPSSIIAEVAALYQGARTSTTIDVAIAVLLTYDALLCIGKEVRYVWKSPHGSRKFSRALYTYNRYMSITWNIVQLGLQVPISDTSCIALHWVIRGFQILAVLGPTSFTTLRVYALSGRNKTLAAIVLLLSMGPFFVNLYTLYQEEPFNEPPPVGCVYNVNTSVASYTATCTILADLVAVVVTWWYTHGARQTSTDILRRSSLEQKLWEGGNLYFCALLSLNVADMILVVLSIATKPNEALDVIRFVDPISSMLNSRFLLALHETNAHLTQGGTSVSSVSLDFGAADRAVGSTELPELLTELAGPIHPAPDYDPELFDAGPESEAEGSMADIGHSEPV